MSGNRKPLTHLVRNQAQALFPTALREGKLTDYLGGFPGYEIANPYANSPTDPDAAFSPIRLLIVEDEALRSKVLEAIRTLAEDQNYGWMAIYYLSALKSLESWKNVSLVTPDLIDAIANSLRKHRAALILNRNCVGADYQDGLWGDVRRMNKILTQKYNLTLLPEEP